MDYDSIYQFTNLHITRIILIPTSIEPSPFTQLALKNTPTKIHRELWSLVINDCTQSNFSCGSCNGSCGTWKRNTRTFNRGKRRHTPRRTSSKSRSTSRRRKQQQSRMTWSWRSRGLRTCRQPSTGSSIQTLTLLTGKPKQVLLYNVHLHRLLSFFLHSLYTCFIHFSDNESDSSDDELSSRLLSASRRGSSLSRDSPAGSRAGKTLETMAEETET